MLEEARDQRSETRDQRPVEDNGIQSPVFSLQSPVSSLQSPVPRTVTPTPGHCCPRAKRAHHCQHIDILWPVLHGPYGEDGTIQGMLEMANLPYVGSGVMASAVCMDKAIAKVIFSAAGLRQTPWHLVLRHHLATKPDPCT